MRKEIINDNMTAFEHGRLAIIKYINKYPNKSDAQIATRFNLNRSTIYRIRKLLRTNPSEAHTHGNKNRTPVNKTNKKESTNIKTLYQETNEKVNEYRGTDDFKISVLDFYNEIYIPLGNKKCYSTVMNVLNDELVLTPNIKKVTKKKIKIALKNLKEFGFNINEISKEDKDTLISQIETVIYKNVCKYEFGESVEIDACLHNWLGSRKTTLYHAVYSRTKRLLFAWMEDEETNHGYLELLLGVFKLYGVPVFIKSDRRKGLFGDDEENGAIKLAVESLGTSIVSRSEPTFKPNVEASFKFMQSALPYMLYKWKIKSSDDFNLKVNEYLNWYNKRYKREFSENSHFTKLSEHEIFYGMLIPVKRKVTNGVVKFKGKYYAPYDNEGNCVLMSEGKTVSLCYSKDNELFFKGNGKLYNAKIPTGKSLTELEHYCIMKNLEVNDESRSLHNAYLNNINISKQNAKRSEELRKREELLRAKAERLKVIEANLLRKQNELNND